MGVRQSLKNITISFLTKNINGQFYSIILDHMHALLNIFI